MKKLKLLPIVCILAALLLFAGCSNDFVLTEKTFFTVMTNINNYPTKYAGKYIEIDCFTYDLTDTDGKVYRLGVRKCSTGVGCTCGKDTIIGFILSYDGEIPEPLNQSEDTVDKTWIHIRGQLANVEYTEIKINSYDADGNITENTETVRFLTFNVETLNIVEDYSNLNYYVTK